MSGPILQVKDLFIEFPGLERTVKAVRGVNLSVERGEIVGLVGESGSGKTMTAMACLGLVPPPGRVSGSIRLAGEEIIGAPEAENERRRGKKAAMIFQNPGKALNPFFTIGRQLIDAVATVRRIDRKAAEAAAMEALNAVRIADPHLAMQKYPHQVSGGQLQRAMIAMALACEPEILIADEPTTALDVTIQAQVIVLLRDLARARGLTVVFITHDLGVVGSLCDRLAVMYAGRIVEQGTTDVVFSAPAHPYTANLLKAVPMLGRGRVALTQIPGTVPNMSNPPPGCAFHPRCPSATAVCSQSAPLLTSDREGHAVACHHPIGAAAPLAARAGAPAA